MQGMIGHHQQALEMVALSATDEPRRHEDARQAHRALAADEIQMMQDWLKARGQSLPDLHAHHQHGATLMPGMLTTEEMARLQAAKGVEFDRLFLEGMIKHHGGALVMVRDLFATPRRRPGRRHLRVRVGRGRRSADGNGSDGRDAQGAAEMRSVTTRVWAASALVCAGRDAGDRAAEAAQTPTIRASGSSPAPSDAGVAARNMELVANLPRPEGFFDPKAPAGDTAPTEASRGAEAAEAAAAPATESAAAPPSRHRGDAGNGCARRDGSGTRGRRRPAPVARRPRLRQLRPRVQPAPTCSSGNFHGFNTYDIENPRKPKLLASIVCPGGQGDVSVYGNLLFMSVEQTRGRVDCGTQGVPRPVSTERFRGVRIFDITDLEKPKPGRGGADLPRLAHAHAGDRSERQGEHLRLRLGHRHGARPARSSRAARAWSPKEDPNTALFSIDVIQVPLARAADARRSSTVRASSPTRRPARSRACGRAAITARARRRTQPDQPVPRHHRVPRGRPRGGRLLGQRHPAGHLRSGEPGAARSRRRTRTSPTGTRRRSTTTAPR